jgi:hypothetical protein
MGDPPAIDLDATQALRARLRASRKPAPDVAWEKLDGTAT